MARERPAPRLAARVDYRAAAVNSDLTCSDINLDGGNVVASRHRVILTTKVFRENPNRTRKVLTKQLHELFQVKELILIPEAPDDPIFGHVDGIVRFIDEDRVIVNDYAHIDPAYGKQLHAILKNRGLQTEELPYHPEDRVRNGIPSAVGLYLNFLDLDRLVIVPSYGHKADDSACNKLTRLFPEKSVVTQRCNRLAREGGVLRCATWTVQRTSKKAELPVNHDNSAPSSS